MQALSDNDLGQIGQGGANAPNATLSSDISGMNSTHPIGFNGSRPSSPSILIPRDLTGNGSITDETSSSSTDAVDGSQGKTKTNAETTDEETRGSKVRHLFFGTPLRHALSVTVLGAGLGAGAEYALSLLIHKFNEEVIHLIGTQVSPMVAFAIAGALIALIGTLGYKLIIESEDSTTSPKL